MTHALRWLVALALGFAHAHGLAHAADPPKPSVVLFIADDLGWADCSPYGGKEVPTPNMARLAADGVTLTHAFVASPSCAPSRAALITGMHQASIGAQNMRTSSFVWADSNRKGYEATPSPEVKAFPELMRAGGYFAINNSKTDYQIGNPFTAWDESGPEAHWRDRPQGAPFFAMYSLQVTHESALFDPGSVNAAGEGSLPNARAADAGRKALAKQTRPEDVEVPPYYPDTPAVRDEIARQYDNVQLMDAWVGDMMKELRQAGLLENTIVVWTTDHGDGLPRGKRSLYDSGLSVPMIIRFPNGKDAGAIDGQLISFVDLAPTLLAFAGVDPPAYMQGRDILDKKTPEPGYVFAARDRFDAVYVDRARAARSKQFKYIHNFKADVPFYGDIPYRDNLATMREMRRLLAEGKLSPLQAGYFTTPRPSEEFYDLRADPHEVNNLAGDARYAGEKLKLQNALERWEADVPDLGAMPERDMVERMWPGGVQPETAAPIIRTFAAASGKRMVELQSLTGGASIGYRLDAAKAGWSLYVGPFEVAAGAQIDAKAIRYGYKESAVSSAFLPP